MHLVITDVVVDAPHQWAAATSVCDPSNDDDPFIGEVAQAVRESYGELALLEAVDSVDPSVSARFNLDAIRRAFGKGLPDPSVESPKKPRQLRNDRSETAEVIARTVLSEAHRIEFPVDPQQGKPNANQPILGFDGWGLLKLPSDEWAFVLVQVKATDEARCPPAEAHVLSEECRRVPSEPDKLCRALTILAVRLAGEQLVAVLHMLELLGDGTLPTLVVAPVVIRGVSSACVDDLEPVRTICASLVPIIGRGASVSIGADLNRVGEAAMRRARAA